MKWPNGSDTWRGWATTQILRLWRRVTRLEEKIEEDDFVDQSNGLSDVDDFWSMAALVVGRPKYLLGFLIAVIVMLSLFWVLEINLPWTEGATKWVSVVPVWRFGSFIQHYVHAPHEQSHQKRDQWPFGPPPGQE